MVVDYLIIPNNVIFLESENWDLEEWDEDRKDKPDVYHSHIWSGGKLLHNADEKCCQHQHYCYIYSESSFKEELFEEGGAVANEDEEDRGKVGGEDLIGQPPFEDDLHLDPKVGII